LRAPDQKLTIVLSQLVIRSVIQSPSRTVISAIVRNYIASYVRFVALHREVDHRLTCYVSRRDSEDRRVDVLVIHLESAESFLTSILVFDTRELCHVSCFCGVWMQFRILARFSIAAAVTGTLAPERWLRTQRM